MTRFIDAYDAWVQSRAQALSLWFWDYWAIPNGYCLTCIIGVLTFFNKNSAMFVPFMIFSLLVSIMFIGQGKLQIRGCYKRINDFAEKVQNSVWHKTLRIFGVLLFICTDFLRYIQRHDSNVFINSLIQSFLVLLFLYFMCVKTRDREPPEHFLFQPNAA